LVNKSELAQVEKRVTMEPELMAPIEKGQQLGSLTVTAGERVLAEIPIVSPVSIPKLSLWQITCNILRRLCMAEPQ
jgi:D-alanyl-D-alanine carboxypeptidase (penicillin-binding protein 5/6)